MHAARRLLLTSMVISICLSLTVFSCTKDVKTDPPTPPPPTRTDSTSNPPPPKTDSGVNVLSDNAWVADTSAIVKFSDGSLVLLSSKMTRIPVAGSILLAAPCAKSPYGFIQRITSVSENAGQLTCTSEPAGLNDAFKKLSINSNYSASSTGSASFKTGPLLNIDFSKSNIFGSGITLDGNLQFNLANVDVEYEKKEGSLAPQKVVIKAELNTDGSLLELTNTNTTLLNIPEKTIKTFDLPPIIIPIAGLPIPLVLKQQVLLKVLPLNVSSSFKVKLSPVIRATVGVQYDGSQWKDLSSLTIDAINYSDFCKEDFSTSADIGAVLTLFNPAYEVTPYGIEALKAVFEVPNQLNFSFDFNGLDYMLDYNLKVRTGLETKFWNSEEKDYTIESDWISKNLAQGHWLYCKLCNGFDLAGWWKSLDPTVQQAFNALIGKTGTDMPAANDAELVRLFNDTRYLSFSQKGLKGVLTIPACFTNLLEVYVAENQLTGINIDGLPNLYEVMAFNNKITSVTLKNLPAFTTLDLDSNALTSIDLSPFGAKLDFLSLTDNKLATLDLSKAPLLSTVNCGDNFLTNIQVSPRMTKLATLHCWNNNLGVAGVRNIWANLPPGQSVWVDYGDCRTNAISETNGPNPNSPYTGSDCDKLSKGPAAQ